MQTTVVIYQRIEQMEKWKKWRIGHGIKKKINKFL